MRTFKRVLAGVLLLAAIGWLALYAREWIFRKRAERLLADIKAIDLNHSSWADAQTLMERWGKWGEYHGTCTSDGCSYRILLSDILPGASGFVFDEGFNLLPRISDHLGLRSAATDARFRVFHGVITSKDYALEVDLPRSLWLRDSGMYWPSLSAGFHEEARLRYGDDRNRSWHPNRELQQIRIYLTAHFTPEESLEEQLALMDIRLECVTNLRPCLDRAQIAPEIEQKWQADTVAHSLGTGSPPCYPTVRIRSREASEIILGTILTLSPPAEKHARLTAPDAGVRFEQTLKGLGHPAVGTILNVPLPVPAEAGQYELMKPGSKVILIGYEELQDRTPTFFVYGCGLAAATAENLNQVKAGIQDDFGPQP